MGAQVLPIDYALSILLLLFVLGEIILSINTMIYVTRKQAAVYYLRNTQTNLITKEEIIKSSKEIEQELFFLFPHLKKEEEKNEHVKTS